MNGGWNKFVGSTLYNNAKREEWEVFDQRVSNGKKEANTKSNEAHSNNHS